MHDKKRMDRSKYPSIPVSIIQPNPFLQPPPPTGSILFSSLCSRFFLYGLALGILPSDSRHACIGLLEFGIGFGLHLSHDDVIEILILIGSLLYLDVNVP